MNVIKKLFVPGFDRKSSERSQDVLDEDLEGLGFCAKWYILVIFVEDAHHSFLHLFELFFGDAPDDFAADICSATIRQPSADGLESHLFCHAFKPLFCQLFYKGPGSVFKGSSSRDPLRSIKKYPGLKIRSDARRLPGGDLLKLGKEGFSQRLWSFSPLFLRCFEPQLHGNLNLVQGIFFGLAEGGAAGKLRNDRDVALVLGAGG